MEASIALKQGSDRGWFTYTDLHILSHDAKFTQICQEISKVFLVSSLTYLTGILTMIGSTVLVTAAMTTLGPIILHSPTRLTPLPITDVLPITKQTIEENVIEEEEPIPHVDEQPSLSTKSIDYLLAELMTVVSLPMTCQLLVFRFGSIELWYFAFQDQQ